MLFTGLFIALTTLGGFIRIPFFPVPLTLQTLFVYLSGTLLGGRNGALCQLLFLVMGLAGLPLFTTGGGLRAVLQPTFGYLLGFPLAAGLIGWLVYRPQFKMKIRSLVPLIVTGSLVLFAMGILYLVVYTKWIVGRPVNPAHLIWAGFVIFIPAELIKIVLASMLTIKLYPFMKGA